MLKQLDNWIIDFDHKISYRIIDINSYEVKVFSSNVECNELKTFVELPKHVKKYLIGLYPGIKQQLKELKGVA